MWLLVLQKLGVFLWLFKQRRSYFKWRNWWFILEMCSWLVRRIKYLYWVLVKYRSILTAMGILVGTFCPLAKITCVRTSSSMKFSYLLGSLFKKNQLIVGVFKNRKPFRKQLIGIPFLEGMIRMDFRFILVSNRLIAFFRFWTSDFFNNWI